MIDQILLQKKAVGIAAGTIGPDGRRVAAHGNLTKGESTAVDGDTIFEIGSISKVFTSLLLADMVERKEVTLQDPAAKYLPAHVRMPERNGRSITLLDLSMHTSGLARIPDNLNPKDPANPYAGYSVDALYEFLSRCELSRDPGSEIAYSNLGAGLLGHVLARRAGMDYESLVRSRITRPLGMPDTGITLSSSMKQRLATGHNAKLAPVSRWDIPTLAGAGALRSSTNDMLTFLEAFLCYRDSPLAAAMNAMLAVRRPTRQTNFEFALGWIVIGDILWHDGGTGGFQSFIGFNPQTRSGVVVLSNTSTFEGVSDIGMRILDPKKAFLQPEVSDRPPEVALDAVFLNEYCGCYQLPDRVLEVTTDGSRLLAQVIAAGGKPIAGPIFEMFAETGNTFFVRMTSSRIVFEVGPEGRTIGLSMLRPGRDAVFGARVP